MGLKSTTAALFVALAAGGIALAGARPTALRFTTVVQDSKPVGSDEPTWGRPQRIGEVQAWVVPDAATMTYRYYAFTTADQRKFDAVNWNTHFVFAAVLKQRTSGFRITIKRITLQRVSRTMRQLCVIASVEKPRPGEGVVVRPTFSEDAVALSSARFRIDQFHWAIPTRFVLRDESRRLLTVSRAGGSFNDYYATGRPKLCGAKLRAADDALAG